ncbi:putative transposase [Enterovibrio norvegicus DSM 15893]|uniref:Putative transposase n=1 Tax=Enterovibrio norvegicus DSM 15893 TaxID=1121869 RepID=A0A1I5MK56_9GAMM|nr:putative transposase [Enterovibrio norvegicus DSM 15893]
MAWVWMCDYNEERSRKSLGNIPPAEYRRKLETSSYVLSR